MATLKEIADQLAGSFESKTRDNGEAFTCLRDGAPEWVSDALFAAHDNGDIMPNDWTYGFARQMADHFEETLRYDEDADLADAVDEASDSLIPCYNGERLQWLASNLNRAALVDEAVGEYGFPTEGGILQAIAYGIQREIHMIGSALASAILEQVEG